MEAEMGVGCSTATVECCVIVSCEGEGVKEKEIGVEVVVEVEVEMWRDREERRGARGRLYEMTGWECQR